MADQNDPKTIGNGSGQIKGIPEQNVPAVPDIAPTEIPLESAGNSGWGMTGMASPSTGGVFPSPVQSEPPPSSPTVVVGGGNKIPKWFYWLFLLTVIIFIVVNAMLVLTVTKNNKGNKGEIPIPTGLPSATKIPVSPTIIQPSPSPVAADSAVIKLDQLDSSDEAPSIEKDILNTDFSPIDQSIGDLDKAAGFTP